MQIKLVKTPSLFMKGLPCIIVLYDDDANAQRFDGLNKAFVVRRDFQFVDSEKLTKRINARTLDSKRGVIIDLRNVLRPRDITFLLNVIGKRCWRFPKYKTQARVRLAAFEKTLYLWCKDEQADMIKALECGNLARELASEPTNTIGGPGGFCKKVKDLFEKRRQVKIEVIGPKQLAKKGLGLLTGMGVASEPHLLILDYTPVGFQKNNHATICIIGKGGCLNTDEYKAGIHSTKTGAAIVVGVVKYACDVMLKHKRIIAVIPLIEDRPSAISVLPGDILKAYNGLTFQMCNYGDGCAIVADTLAYACDEYNPDILLDIGTFTGWANRQHGGLSYVYFTLCDNLAKALKLYGERVGERSIQLPPWSEYSDYVSSGVADLKDASSEYVGEGNMASLFLLNFVSEKLRKRGWVHIDISNTTNADHPEISYCNGVASCIELVRHLKLR